MAQLINAQSLFQTLYLFRVIANKMYYCSLEISINIPFLHKRICLVSSSLSARFWSWIKSSRSMFITPPTLEPTMEPYDCYTLNTGAYHGTIWLLHPQHWRLPWNHMIITPPTLEPTMEPHDYYTPNTGAYHGTTSPACRSPGWWPTCDPSPPCGTSSPPPHGWVVAVGATCASLHAAAGSCLSQHSIWQCKTWGEYELMCVKCQ